MAARVPGGPAGLRPRARLSRRDDGRGLRDVRPLPGEGARRAPAGRRHQAGGRIGRHTELVISIFDHPLAGRVVVGILRPRDERKMQRWSELTTELLEILADAPIDEPPAERLLSTLGRRLDWDVTTLWALGQPGAGLPAPVDAHAERRAGLRPGEGGDPRAGRRPAPVGSGPRRAPLGARSQQ